MIRLGVNIDHVATLRQLRAGLVDYPNVFEAAKLAVKAGADQITVHLRQDRRHIQDYDLKDLFQNRPAPINFECAATDEMIKIAVKFKPEIVCLVPEKRQEITTEGGLDVIKNKNKISKAITTLHSKKIKVSLFIEPDQKQIKMSADLKTDAVEFHTGKFALARGMQRPREKERLRKAFALAHDLDLHVHAGHGLDYYNITDLVDLPHLEEVNIGHSIVCRSVFVGLESAVREMKEKLQIGN